MKFIDIHSHLDICKKIPEVVENCNEREIVIVTCGTDVKTNRKTLEIKEKYPEVEICLGIYPLDGLKMSEEDLEKEIQFIRENKNKIFGIGEVGLDLHSIKDSENFAKQKEVFGKMIELAKEFDKPIFVHSREAEKETVEFLEGFGFDKIVMHCFSGNMKLVKRIINNNWDLSIPASVKYNEHFQKIVEIADIKNLFCETDSPFLHPDKIQGMKNTPENVLESYNKISEIKNLKLEEVKEKVWKNFENLK